jgi:hypothetical protein
MSLQAKIPIVRLQGIPEGKTYWAVIADERDDMDKPFIQREVETCGHDELDLAKRLAIIHRRGDSCFKRNVKIVQKVIDDQFC